MDARARLYRPGRCGEHHRHVRRDHRRREVHLQPVRGALRAASVPLSRRARLQGAVAAHARRAEGPRRARQHAGHQRERARRRSPRRVRDHEAAAVLPDRVRGRSARDRAGRHLEERDADPDRHVQGPRSRGRVRREEHREDRRLARGVVRHAVPLSQARSAVDSGDQRLRRDGEPRPRHVHRVAVPVRRQTLVGAARRADLGRRPRARASVVRRSHDDGVVGRHLVERRLRELDGEQDHRPVRAELALRSAGGRDAPVGARLRRARDRTADPPADRRAGRHPQRVRWHHVQQRRLGPEHVRELRRRRRVPARRARVPQGARLRQRDLGRLHRCDQHSGGQGSRARLQLVPRSVGRTGARGDAVMWCRAAPRARAAPLRARWCAHGRGDQAVGRARVRGVRTQRCARRGLHGARCADGDARAPDDDLSTLGDAERQRTRLLSSSLHRETGDHAARRGVAAADVE